MKKTLLRRDFRCSNEIFVFHRQYVYMHSCMYCVCIVSHVLEESWRHDELCGAGNTRFSVIYIYIFIVIFFSCYSATVPNTNLRVIENCRYLYNGAMTAIKTGGCTRNRDENWTMIDLYFHYTIGRPHNVERNDNDFSKQIKNDNLGSVTSVSESSFNVPGFLCRNRYYLHLLAKRMNEKCF